jgi:hypothetical protein
MNCHTTHLANDICRCMGLMDADSAGPVTVCDRRSNCARYVLIGTGGERTPFSSFLCRWVDDKSLYDNFIQFGSLP